MIPYSKPPDGDSDAWMISDVWYVGAFGKWWRGGALEAWYRDVIKSKDKESWTSGILTMKRLDILPDHARSFYFCPIFPPIIYLWGHFLTAGFRTYLARGPLPELRNRERSTPKQITAQPRSSTPPPLPKSVSLPLHTIQVPLTNVRYSCDRLSKIKSSPPRPCIVNDPSRHGTCSTQSRSCATLLEHSPLLDEVLRQITNSKESVLDIRTQLGECQLVTTRSHAILQCEVETYRERKQQEDAARLELKSRIKLLDDSKRGAEGAKRDAEKNLKAAQLVRDNVGHQLESLHQRILALQGHLLEDRDFIFRYQKQSLEHVVNDALEQKKADIQAAEHSVTILNQRSRELEDRLSSHRERLRILRQKSENQRTCYPFLDDMDPASQHYERRSHPLPQDHTDDVSGSFGRDGDPRTERNWYGGSCNRRHHRGFASLSSIPTFIIPALSDSDRPFEADLQPYDELDCLRPVEHTTNWTQSLDLDVNLPAPYHTPGTDPCHATSILDQSQHTRSLASTSLNINEASLGDNPCFELSSDSGKASESSIFDALNPNGLSSTLVTPPSSTSQSFLRAFAPSPAEREVLQRALGGSTNASFERLPSLSVVGNLPSSPTSCHVHGLSHSHSLRDLRNFLPTWLKGFPRSDSVKFSPWEDEDLRNGDQYFTPGASNAT